MHGKGLIILHAAIAGCIAAFVTSMGYRGLSRTLEWDALTWSLAGAAVICLGWFICSVGLLFRRRWGWWGSLVCVLSICSILGYFMFLPTSAGPHSDPSGFLRVVFAALLTPFAGAVLLLLLIWRQLFRDIRYDAH